MIPYAVERRADTGVTNVTMAVWLFLASEVMLFGALFSAYALLRVSAVSWPDGREVLDVRWAIANTIVLLLAAGAIWNAQRQRPGVRAWMLAATLLAVVFVIFKAFEYREDAVRALRPAANTFLAMYYTLTGLHAVHVAGGLVANLWILAGASRIDPRLVRGRLRALALYWTFVDFVWIVIVILIYFS